MESGPPKGTDAENNCAHPNRHDWTIIGDIVCGILQNTVLMIFSVQ